MWYESLPRSVVTFKGRNVYRKNTICSSTTAYLLRRNTSKTLYGARRFGYETGAGDGFAPKFFKIRRLSLMTTVRCSEALARKLSMPGDCLTASSDLTRPTFSWLAVQNRSFPLESGSVTDLQRRRVQSLASKFYDGSSVVE